MALLDLLRDAEIYEDEIMAADNDSSLLYIDSDEAADAVTFDSVVDSTEAGGMELQQAAGNKSKCIIFCQFTKTLDLVESILPRTLRLDGKVPAAERAQVAERFNTDPTIRILLSTTRVGGLGLNLTGADTVIFLENDFNPFADLQAQDRAHRIGQRSTVNIYNLVTQDSIEETIMELQRKKIAVSNAIVNSENSSLYSMGTDRLLDIFGNDDDTFDVDALVEEYREDYKSFGVQEFLKNIV
jgi:TATA-binding protein-associated factor